MARAWLFQDARQKAKLGDKTKWSVGWIDPNGKRKSKTVGSESQAEKFRRKKEGELASGLYQPIASKSWKDFRKEYEERVLCHLKPRSLKETVAALERFEKVIGPVKVDTITTSDIDNFISKRKQVRGKKPESKLSPASINRDLRHLKAALNVAKEWGHLRTVPKIRMVKEPKKLIRYMTAEHFAAIYESCDIARWPDTSGENFTAAEWWRALLAMLYMTGWRISETLALKREDLDLKAKTAITRAADNKAGRDEKVPLHDVVVEHLKPLMGFSPVIFPWPHSYRQLWTEFTAIQKKAKIHLPCLSDHEHTDSCHSYGFHDCRRAFATLNAETLTPDALQALMRHKSYLTTQRYISMARQLNTAVDGLHVPDVFRKAE